MEPFDITIKFLWFMAYRLRWLLLILGIALLITIPIAILYAWHHENYTKPRLIKELARKIREDEMVKLLSKGDV